MTYDLNQENYNFLFLQVGVKIEGGDQSAGTCRPPDKPLLIVLHSNRFILSVILGFICMVTLCTYSKCTFFIGCLLFTTCTVFSISTLHSTTTPH